MQNTSSRRQRAATPPAWPKTRQPFRRPVLSVIATLLAAIPAHGATVEGTFGGWTLYSYEDAAGKICFLAAPPASTEPANLKRDPALLYISAWPKDGVKSEVSIKLGFPVKKSPEPTASVASPAPAPATFKLFAKDDRVYVADATQELKLLETMKKGSKLTVQATSERGTTVTDTYTLTGLTAALQAIANGCP